MLYVITCFFVLYCLWDTFERFPFCNRIFIIVLIIPIVSYHVDPLRTSLRIETTRGSGVRTVFISLIGTTASFCYDRIVLSACFLVIASLMLIRILFVSFTFHSLLILM